VGRVRVDYEAVGMSDSFLFGLFCWGLEQELGPKLYPHMLCLIVIANGLLRVSSL
jgi:hypothetical protein